MQAKYVRARQRDGYVKVARDIPIPRWILWKYVVRMGGAQDRAQWWLLVLAVLNRSVLLPDLVN